MEHTIAPFIEDYILADLMVMKTHLSPDYYDINQIDKYGPMVVVMSRKEFKKIEDARKYRDEVKNYSFAKTLGLKGFWVCKGERMTPKKPLPVPPA